MVTKKAFIRTLEAIIAIVITFIFLVAILPIKEPGLITEKKIKVLGNLADDEIFRMKMFNLDYVNQCFTEQEEWLNNSVRYYLSDGYEYRLCIYDTLDYPLLEYLPDKEVFVDSLFITKDLSDYERRIVRFYYWIR